MKKWALLFSFVFAAALTGNVFGVGKHKGEAGKISATVEFLGAAGETTTDGLGITYRSGSWAHHEPKIYHTSYWGTFPLYFLGQTMRFSVTVENKTQKGKKPFRIRIRALNNVLETDGRMGQALSPPMEWMIGELRPGKSQTRTFSFYLDPDPSIPSGLDITKIQILHLNQGRDEDAGLIREDIAVWCPPGLKDTP